MSGSSDLGFQDAGMLGGHLQSTMGEESYSDEMSKISSLHQIRMGSETDRVSSQRRLDSQWVHGYRATHNSSHVASKIIITSI